MCTKSRVSVMHLGVLLSCVLSLRCYGWTLSEFKGEKSWDEGASVTAEIDASFGTIKRVLKQNLESFINSIPGTKNSFVLNGTELKANTVSRKMALQVGFENGVLFPDALFVVRENDHRCEKEAGSGTRKSVSNTGSSWILRDMGFAEASELVEETCVQSLTVEVEGPIKTYGYQHADIINALEQSKIFDSFVLILRLTVGPDATKSDLEVELKIKNDRYIDRFNSLVKKRVIHRIPTQKQLRSAFLQVVKATLRTFVEKEGK